MNADAAKFSNNLNPENSNLDPFKVYIRIRPLNEKEIQQCERTNQDSRRQIRNNILLPEENLLFVLDPESQDLNGRKERSFAFDDVFTERDSNEMIFTQGIKCIMDNILKGYNSTVLAYGVTGTGKTHTIFGSINFDQDTSFNEEGICLLAVNYLFNQITSLTDKIFNVKISYLEIYNEHVIDLLVPKSSSLMIVEDSTKGVYVPDLTEYTVKDTKEILQLIVLGNSRRTMAPTTQNQVSSRSHAILQIQLEQKSKWRDTKEEILVSKFLLVDLAGSERGGLEKGVRREEGANINKSLLSLGNCINLLSDKTKRGAFVPYRDSKLTRLLKDSLGGNIQTVMIACVSPSVFSYDETVNTLKYASRARTIEKKVVRNVKEVNAHISQYKEIIDSLKAEIEQLKEVIKNQEMMLTQMPKGDDNKILQTREQAYINRSNTSEIKANDDRGNNQGNLSNLIKMKSSSSLCRKKSSQLKRRNTDSYKMLNNSNNSSNNIKSNNVSIGNLTRSSIYSINLDSYKSFLVNEGEFNLAQLEEQIDNLKKDKFLIEEYMGNSQCDTQAKAKYETIKLYFEKFLELINDKLIENIEQNMILKFNLKEILELNTTNENHLQLLYTQVQRTNNPDEVDKINEEIRNIKISSEENEKIKLRITESLSKNLKLKKMLRKIMFKLVSHVKTVGGEDSVVDKQKFLSVIKEKEELENKTEEYENILRKVIQDQKEKDKKLSEMQKELDRVKKKLKQNELEKEKDRRSLQPKEERVPSLKLKENVSNLKFQESKLISTPSQKEITQLNLQDDYFNNRGVCDNSRNRPEESDCTTEANVQRIKYIINQTNNIVNNNINKIIKKDNEKRINSDKNLTPLPKTGKKPMAHKQSRNSRASGINSARMRSSSTNIKEYDKLIESQLNEVYNRKAKQLGDKIRRSNIIPSKKNLKINIKDIINNAQGDKPEVNRSLSISRVSFNNDNDECNSEFEIVDNLPSTKNKLVKNNFLMPDKERNVSNLVKFATKDNNDKTSSSGGILSLIPSKSNDIPIQPHLRDYSPSARNVESLSQARLASKLKQREKGNESDTSETLRSSSLVPNLNLISHSNVEMNNSNNLNLNVITSNSNLLRKNTSEFINDYINIRNAEKSNDVSKSKDNKPAVYLHKAGDYKTYEDYTTEQEDNIYKEFSPEDLFKSLETVKNPKLAKFLK